MDNQTKTSAELICQLSKNNNAIGNSRSILPERLQIFRNKYGDSGNFLVRFNPAKQLEYVYKHRLQCFSADVPTLRDIDRLYHQNITISWLEIQLRDLAEFSGVKEKMSTQQIESVASTILCEFSYLKVTELMVFFQLFKSGKYGKFYGVVDGMAITEALWAFIDYRGEQLRIVEKEKYQKEKQAKAQIRKAQELRGEILIPQEWADLKWLFNM